MEERQVRTRERHRDEEDERGVEKRRNKFGGKGDRGVQAAEEVTGGSRKQEEQGERGESKYLCLGTNCRGEGEEVPHRAQFSSLQIPSTVTQAYLTLLGAFLSRGSNREGRDDEPKTTALPER